MLNMIFEALQHVADLSCYSRDARSSIFFLGWGGARIEIPNSSPMGRGPPNTIGKACLREGEKKKRLRLGTTGLRPQVCALLY